MARSFFLIWQSLHFSLPTQFIAICASTRLQDQHIANSLVVLKSESAAIDKHWAWPHFTLPFSDVEDNVSLFPWLVNRFKQQQMWMNQLFGFVLCHCLCLCLFVGHFACTNSCVLYCRSSTCATRTGGGSLTCAATTPASTRSSGSATGTTTSTAQTRQIGQSVPHPTIFHHFCHLIVFNTISFQFWFVAIPWYVVSTNVAGITWTTSPTGQTPHHQLKRKGEGEAGIWVNRTLSWTRTI